LLSIDGGNHNPVGGSPNNLSAIHGGTTFSARVRHYRRSRQRVVHLCISKRAENTKSMSLWFKKYA
jgi:hypothetical protein